MTSKIMKKIASAAPFFDDEDIETISQDIKQILKNKKLVLGPYTQKFEKLFSEYHDTKYGVAVSSATAALEIVLTYCNVKDAEVIVPCNTFIACPNTVIYAGGKPVFADMNPKTFCIDIDDVRKKISPKTKVIMAVHLGGLPEPEMDALDELCKEKGIHLMEDASHAHGATTLKGRKVGSLGIAGCFSLFATKILPTGTGGMMTTDDPKLQEFAEAFRHQGGMGGEGRIEVFDKFGYDFMMNEMTATLGINQLLKLDKHLEKRRKIAAQYEKELSKIDGVHCLPKVNPGNVYWKFITVLDENIDRNKVRLEMREKHMIDAGILYPTLCHLQPVYTDLGYKEGECPTAERIIKHQLTLPVNPYMTEEDVSYVVESLHDVIQKKP